MHTRCFGGPAVSGRPVGFPSRPRGWFSIVGYLVVFFSVRVDSGSV